MLLKSLLVFTFLFVRVFAFQAVTYPKDGGRFGDRLIAYIHAKWRSMQDGVPLVYHPFPYSENLVLSQEELHLAEAGHFLEPSELYICPYFPEAKSELQRDEWKDLYFKVDFENQEFLWNLRKLIAPLEHIDCIQPPKDQISIALHIREGGGFDASDLSLYEPHKSPPFCFYPICLNKVLELLGGRKAFCFVFTDAKDPASLVEKLKKEVPENAPISFHYRETGNSHKNNVLEDFFSFQNFDILIRPDSNFSIVPSLIHPFSIVCSPVEFWFDEEGYPHTKEVEVQVNHFRL